MILGTETNREKIVKLKEKMWLDLYTREVSVKFIFYNGNVGTFSYVDIAFGFNTYGTHTCCSVLQSVAACFSVLQFVAECCRVLLCVAIFDSQILHTANCVYIKKNRMLHE